MNLNIFKRLSAGVALGLALLTCGTAHSTVVPYNVDVTGILSNDVVGAPGNETRLIYVRPFAHIVSIGWDVNLTADMPSWLQELAVDISDGGASGFSLTPGFGAAMPGTGSFSGFTDLVSLGFDFFLSSTGFLHLEFFETFKDNIGGRDGIWNRGSLSVGVVPEPGSIALVALALLAAGTATRRRAKSA